MEKGGGEWLTGRTAAAGERIIKGRRDLCGVFNASVGGTKYALTCKEACGTTVKL